MLEIYALNWNETQCGIITYDTETKKLSAELLYPENEFPAGLFGLRGQLPKRNDYEVRAFIKDRIVPPTRENIVDVLQAMGLRAYDEWEIYKKLEGRVTKDCCNIQRIFAE